CGLPMPSGMRFCRSCGNRLGEGPAEYTETVRLPNGRTSPAIGTTPFYPSVNAPLIEQSRGSFRRRRKRLGFTGMTWMWIALAVFFASGGALSMLKKNIRVNGTRIGSFTASRSFAGVDEFRAANGGVTFNNVDAPGGPADKAGLVGGDIITSFDGQSPKSEDEMM